MTNFQTRWHVTQPDVAPSIPPSSWWNSCSSKPETAVADGINSYMKKQTPYGRDVHVEAENPDDGTTHRWLIQIRQAKTTVLTLADGKHQKNERLSQMYADRIKTHQSIMQGGNSKYIGGGTYMAKPRHQDPFDSDWDW